MPLLTFAGMIIIIQHPETGQLLATLAACCSIANFALDMVSRLRQWRNALR